jgi:hypothetical protein
VVNHAAQRRGNGVQKGVQVEFRDDGIVHLEQNAQPVALLRQLPLVGLRAFDVQRVVHRDGHLPRHLLQERDFPLGMSVRRAPAEAQHAQPALRRRERHRTGRPHAVLAQNLEQQREARFLLDVIQNKGLLRFPDPSRRRFTEGEFGPRANFAGFFGFEDVQPHDVARGVMQGQIEVIELHHAMQPLGEFMEQLPEVAVLGDRLRHFEQRLVLRFRRRSGQWVRGSIAHTSENSIQARHGSTRGTTGAGNSTASFQSSTPNYFGRLAGLRTTEMSFWISSRKGVRNFRLALFTSLSRFSSGVGS